jgi:hypothetical protein
MGPLLRDRIDWESAAFEAELGSIQKSRSINDLERIQAQDPPTPDRDAVELGLF